MFKHILGNPFAVAWPTLTDEQTNSLATLLTKEVEAQSLPALLLPVPVPDTPSKRRKLDEPNLVKTAKKTLILGVNSIAESIDKVEIVVVLRSKENQVLVEPVWHLCRAKRVKIVSASYEIAIEKMSMLTGVHRLAAFAIPKTHNLPISTAFLASHSRLLPPFDLLPCVLSRIETTQKSPPAPPSLSSPH